MEWIVKSCPFILLGKGKQAGIAYLVVMGALPCRLTQQNVQGEVIPLQ
jgi:hypothetical protein